MNEFGVWTTLKLISVAFWQDVYTTIISEHLKGLKRRTMAYLDVMAGSGLNRIRDGGYKVGGSTILAARIPKKPFDYIVAIEKEPRRAAALDARLAAIRDRSTFKVIPDEADRAIAGVLADLERRKAHFLAFVDYEGLKGFSSDSMELLLNSPCDVWFTYFPSVKRVWANDRDDCRPLFGNLVDVASDYDDLLGRWAESLIRRRRILYPFTIDSGEGYYYQLLFLTRRTLHGSPYLEAARYLSRRLDGIKGDFAKKVLQILSGQQTQLDGQDWAKRGD